MKTKQYQTPKRLGEYPHGLTVETLGGNAVVPLDAVAMISGVSTQNVARVLAAVDLLETVGDIAARTVCGIRNLPTENPTRERLKDAAAVAREVLAHANGYRGYAEVCDYLGLAGRLEAVRIS